MSDLLSLVTTELDGLIERERRDERVRVLRDVVVALSFEIEMCLDRSESSHSARGTDVWSTCALQATCISDAVVQTIATLGDPDAQRLAGGSHE